MAPRNEVPPSEIIMDELLDHRLQELRMTHLAFVSELLHQMDRMLKVYERLIAIEERGI